MRRSTSEITRSGGAVGDELVVTVSKDASAAHRVPRLRPRRQDDRRGDHEPHRAACDVGLDEGVVAVSMTRAPQSPRRRGDRDRLHGPAPRGSHDLRGAGTRHRWALQRAAQRPERCRHERARRSPESRRHDCVLIAEVKAPGALDALGRHARRRPQWNSCGAITDPDPIDTALAGANCITTNGARTQIQVRIPDSTDECSLRQRCRRERLRSRRVRHRRSQRSAGFGNVLPFGMPVSAGGGDGYACIKSGSGGTSVEPCDGADVRQLRLRRLRSVRQRGAVGTTPDCGNGGQRDSARANNMAVGRRPRPEHLRRCSAQRHRGRGHGRLCQQVPQIQRPNSMDTLTGNTVSQALEPGMAFGTGFSDGDPGRLARTDPLLFAGGGETRSVAGTQLDDNPLWEFIPSSFPAGASVPASCEREVFDDVFDGDLSNLPDQRERPARPQAAARADAPPAAALLHPLQRHRLERQRGHRRASATPPRARTPAAPTRCSP